MKKILVIEDDNDMCLLYKSIFRNYEIYCVNSVRKGETYLSNFPIDILIIDIFLYEKSPGYTILPYINKMKKQKPKIIFFSAFTQDYIEKGNKIENFNDYIYIQKGSMDSMKKLKEEVITKK